MSKWELIHGRQSFTWVCNAMGSLQVILGPMILSLLAVGSNSRGRKAHLFETIIFKGKLLQDFCLVDLLTTAVTK